MPDLYGKSYKDAEAMLKKLGLNFEVDGGGDIIVSTIPLAGEKVREKDVVLLKMQNI